MNLTLGQKIAMLSVVLGVLAGATAQLTPLMGATAASSVASLASLINTVVSGWIFIVTGQSAMVKEVAAMPGIEPLKVNALANQNLAQVALDPAVNKVAPTESARAVVIETAKGA